MPRVTLTDAQRQDRAFLAALRYGQELRGEKDVDTAKVMPSSQKTYYNHIKQPASFSVRDARILAQRYFNDRQLCDAFGVEYHGGTERIRSKRGEASMPSSQSYQTYRDQLVRAGQCERLKERILDIAVSDSRLGPDELLELVHLAYPDREVGA